MMQPSELVQLPEGSITVMLPSDSVHIRNEHTTFGYFVRVLASVIKTTNEGPLLVPPDD